MRLNSLHGKLDVGSYSNSIGTDTAGSDVTRAYTFSELSSSSLFSTSGPLNFDDGTDHDLPLSPHGFKLDSGLAFVSLFRCSCPRPLLLF